MTTGTTIALVVVAVLLIALLFLPLRVHASLQGRGDPSGAWALAGGGRLGPFSLAGARAAGAPLALQLHCGRFLIWRGTAASVERALAAWRRRLAPRATSAEPEPTFAERRAALERAYARFERWLDPTSFVLFVLAERRRVRVDRLELDADFSFADITLTGKVLGALYLLGGVLPPPIVVRPSASWESVDRASGALALSISVWPGLAAVDAGWWLVRNLRWKRARSAAPARDEDA